MRTPIVDPLIIVVVAVDGDTYYWVYSVSSDHLFQVYYKVRQLLLQCTTAYYKVRWSVITKCDSSFITKCDRYYIKCDKFITMYDSYYKV